MAEKFNQRLCLKGLSIKEDGEDLVVKGLVATTHPDRVGDILSHNAINEIVDYINDISQVGDQNGAYRMCSLYHDWIKQGNPTLDEAAFLKPTARVVELDNGHIGVEVDAVLNKYYRGELGVDEIKYRIDNGQIAGFSIEYDNDESRTKHVSLDGNTYRYIDGFSEFGGVGLARARMIANPYAVIYKEIEEVAKMEEDKPIIPEGEAASEAPIESAPVEPVAESKEAQPEAKSEEPSSEPQENNDKTELESKELKLKEIELRIKEQIMSELNVQSKIIKQTKEDENKMEANQIPLSVKEMNDALKSNNLLSFKEASSNYFAENNDQVISKMSNYGIPLNTTMKVKCVGNKLQVVGGLQIKSVLNSGSNPGAYTESIVEFADLFVPGLVETFNNQANLFGALNKRDHLMGGNMFGWRIKTDQASSLSVDPDDPSVVFNPVDKLKLHTEIKEYRVGVSVTDYLAHHARASMGDVLMLEAQARMDDLMRDINNDLFTEQVDTAGNKILGLEAVADSAGNTAMYGKTRSTANRLAPTAAGDTYQAIGGALTTAKIREAMRKVEVEGALRSNLRIIVNPKQRDALFELEDGNQNYYNSPQFGFNGQISYDGVPVIVDSSCQEDALFVVDFASYYLVISKAPQLIGLAKVGAADSAFISVYLAAVYEQPRRIHMLDTLA
jgi:hypothetical protein